MRQILTTILLLACCSIGMQAQEGEVGTTFWNIQVIDEVRYLLLRNAEFKLYDSNGKPITFESYESKSTVNGKEVFKLAVLSATKDIELLLSRIGLCAAQIKYYVLHQANMRIIEAVAERLGLDISYFPHNVD